MNCLIASLFTDLFGNIFCLGGVSPNDQNFMSLCGESLRCSYRAFRSVAVRPGLVDVFGIHRPDDDARREFEPALAIANRFGELASRQTAGAQ